MAHRDQTCLVTLAHQTILSDLGEPHTQNRIKPHTLPAQRASELGSNGSRSPDNDLLLSSLRRCTDDRLLTEGGRPSETHEVTTNSANVNPQVFVPVKLVVPHCLVEEAFKDAKSGRCLPGWRSGGMVWALVYLADVP